MALSKNPYLLSPCGSDGCTVRPRPGENSGRPHGGRLGTQTKAFSRDARRVTKFTFS
jgi:hypothetical protein